MEQTLLSARARRGRHHCRVQHDACTWEEAFGLADAERGIRATPDTQYAIASITKPITDYLGKESIRAHADDASKATVRTILQHRGGIAEHNQYYHGDDAAKRPPMDETIRLTTSRRKQSRTTLGVLHTARSRAVRTRE